MIMKVHILVAGWDKDRSVWGCTRIGADKVYVVVPEGVKEEIDNWVNVKTMGIADGIKQKYSKYFSIEFLPVIYDDYLDCFKKMIKIMKKEKEKNNEIFVNISSGSHVATSAAIFAASLMNCKAYYVLPEKYDKVLEDKDRFISYGGKVIVDIPLLPISNISPVEIELLKIIEKSGEISVSELARKSSKLFSSAARSKFNYYVTKLGELGFLSNRTVSGSIYTKIKDSGKMIIEV